MTDAPWPFVKLASRQPDFYIGGQEHPYCIRWWVIPRNKFFNIYLHRFLRDDDDRALHDHPWDNCSIPLRSGYGEITKDGSRRRRSFRIYFRRAETAHRVVLLRNKDDGTLMESWSLFITGPVRREWGFHCPKGWRHWKEFVSERDVGTPGRGCE